MFRDVCRGSTSGWPLLLVLAQRQVAELCLCFCSITLQCCGWHSFCCCKQDQGSSSVSSRPSRPPDTFNDIGKNSTDWYIQSHLHTFTPSQSRDIPFACRAKATFACACCFVAMSAVSISQAAARHCSVPRLPSIWLGTWRGRTSRERR